MVFTMVTSSSHTISRPRKPSVSLSPVAASALMTRTFLQLLLQLKSARVSTTSPSADWVALDSFLQPRVGCVRRLRLHALRTGQRCRSIDSKVARLRMVERDQLLLELEPSGYTAVWILSPPAQPVPCLEQFRCWSDAGSFFLPVLRSPPGRLHSTVCATLQRPP